MQFSVFNHKGVPTYAPDEEVLPIVEVEVVVVDLGELPLLGIVLEVCQFLSEFLLERGCFLFVKDHQLLHISEV